MNTVVIPTVGGMWSLTSNKALGDNRYVTKWPTRKAGPWSEKTVVREEIPLTDDVKQFIERGLMPWHEVALKFKDTFAHNFSAASPNMTRVLTVGQVASYEGL